MILLLAACGGLGLQPLTTGDTGAAAAVVVDAIDPSWGPPDETTEVTVTGEGLEGAVTVAFGRSDPVGATRIDDRTVVVTAPAAGVETAVDVVVTSDLGTATVPGGFTYSEEPPPEDTGDGGGGGGGGDNAGKVGGVVILQLLQVACPSCFGVTSSIEVSAVGVFHEATSASWGDWLPASGSCAVDPVANNAASTFLDAGEWMYLASGSRSIGLRKDRDGVYADAGDLVEGDFVRNAGYSVSVDGGADLAAFQEKDAFTTPQSITSVTPADMLLTNQRDAFSARVSKSNARLTWSPSGGGGSFLVVVDAYSSSNGTFIGETVCLGSDNGSLTIPSASLPFPTNSLLAIFMYRWVDDGYERPDDRSTVEAQVSFGVLGTGVLAP